MHDGDIYSLNFDGTNLTIDTGADSIVIEDYQDGAFGIFLGAEQLMFVDSGRFSDVSVGLLADGSLSVSVIESVSGVGLVRGAFNGEVGGSFEEFVDFDTGGEETYFPWYSNFGEEILATVTLNGELVAFTESYDFTMETGDIYYPFSGLSSYDADGTLTHTFDALDTFGTLYDGYYPAFIPLWVLPNVIGGVDLIGLLADEDGNRAYEEVYKMAA